MGTFCLEHSQNTGTISPLKCSECSGRMEHLEKVFHECYSRMFSQKPLKYKAFSTFGNKGTFSKDFCKNRQLGRIQNA